MCICCCALFIRLLISLKPYLKHIIIQKNLKLKSKILRTDRLTHQGLQIENVFDFKIFNGKTVFTSNSLGLMIVFSTKTEAFKNKQNNSYFEITIVSCCHGLLVFLNLLPCLIIINYYIYRETCHAQGY